MEKMLFKISLWLRLVFQVWLLSAPSQTRVHGHM